MARFNRSLYCIINHDNEVGSKGLLFFGATGVPVIAFTGDKMNDNDWEESPDHREKGPISGMDNFLTFAFTKPDKQAIKSD
jgi:hypothetical protein